jgi:hypothetical protein
MQLSKESIEQFQKDFEKDLGVKYSYDEAAEAAHNLVGFFDLLIKIDRENKEREKNAITKSS